MMETKVKILVLGATGMLGNALLRYFARSVGFDTIGSARSAVAVNLLPTSLRERVVCGIDVDDMNHLTQLFSQVRPDVVVNCIGLVRQLADANDPLLAIPINALLPHRLARLSEATGARLIQIGTDCVFDGARGMYVETDHANATDLYGLSKYLGEVDYPHAVTLRTSMIGHELSSAAHGLIGWFLGQTGEIKGFTRAVFSGLPTVELAHVIRDYVIPHPDLQGLYHVSAEPISKHDLLRLVADVYGKNIQIAPDDKVVIDRSLDSKRFRARTGYVPPSWPELVRSMHAFG